MSDRGNAAQAAEAMDTIRVGPSGADVVGETGRAIQIAVDALAQRGGGTVRLGKGTFLLDDAVRLRPRTRLVGEGAETVLRRRSERLVWSPLAVDADVGQSEITPADASAFRPGMGLCRWDNVSGWVEGSQPLVLTGVVDGNLMINDWMRADRWAERDGRVANFFPLVLAEFAEDCTVEGLTVDASLEDPEGVLDAMRGAAIYFYHSARACVRHVLARGSHGDGIIFGKASVDSVCEDVEACDNRHHGVHPGSHSARFALRRSHLHHNGSDGLYICWGIRDGVFEENHIHHNGWRIFRSGISIGHKDTDNLLARNRVHDNAKFGICIRQKTEANGAHRCTYRENVIENNGSRPGELAEIKAQLEPWESVGVGVSVCGITHDLVFEGNVIRETRSGDERTQRHAMWLGPGAHRVRAMGNEMSGHPGAAIVDESGSGDHELAEA